MKVSKLTILISLSAAALLSGCTDSKAEAERKAKEEARQKFIEAEAKAEEAMMKKLKSIPFRTKYQEVEWKGFGEEGDPDYGQK